MDMDRAHHQHVGQKIRELRETNNLSLRDLAQKCGLSINAISRIERGQNSPTVSSLQRIADGLGISVVSLFERPRQRSIVFTSTNDTVKNQLPGVLIENLTFGLLNQQVEPIRITSDPQYGIDEELLIHFGQEFVYCVRGMVEYCIAGEQYCLNPGDSLMFDADLKHSWKNVGKSQAVQLVLLMSLESDASRGHYHQINRSHRSE
jgi:transcriptional regulator with XRE-family HTH domain